MLPIANVCHEFAITVFGNFSLPAKRKSSTCTIINPLRELCHVNIDGSISYTFPSFAKTNAFIHWHHFNNASKSLHTHFFSFKTILISQFASTRGFT